MGNRLENPDLRHEHIGTGSWQILKVNDGQPVGRVSTGG